MPQTRPSCAGVLWMGLESRDQCCSESPRGVLPGARFGLVVRLVFVRRNRLSAARKLVSPIAVPSQYSGTGSTSTP